MEKDKISVYCVKQIKCILIIIWVGNNSNNFHLQFIIQSKTMHFCMLKMEYLRWRKMSAFFIWKIAYKTMIMQSLNTNSTKMAKKSRINLSWWPTSMSSIFRANKQKYCNFTTKCTRKTKSFKLFFIHRHFNAIWSNFIIAWIFIRWLPIKKLHFWC